VQSRDAVIDPEVSETASWRTPEVGCTAAAPLHTADWRFLLPRATAEPLQHLVLIGGPVGLPALLRQVRLADHVSRELPRDHSADAVVVLHGARAPIPDVAASLREGGSLYYEVSRLTLDAALSSPARLKHQLRQHGLTASASYAIAPHPTQAMVYLPLEVPAALRWYVETVYDTLTWPRALLQWGYRAVRSVSSTLLAATYPWYAVTATAGPSRRQLPAELDRLHELTDVHPDEVVPLLLADTGNRVVMLPFRKAGSAPELVLKIPKVAAVNDRTENEQRVLTELRSRMSPGLQRTIPQPVALLQHDGISIAVENYLPGESIKHFSSRWTRSGSDKLDDLSAAGRWLGEFHRQTEIERQPWTAQAAQDWLAQPIARFRVVFGETTAEQKLFASATAYAAALDDLPFPLAWHHRDFNIWNVFRAKGRVNVLDWEGGRPGPPLCDLLHFTTHWHEAVTRSIDEPRRMKALRRLWVPACRQRSPYVRGAHRVIQEYMQRIELDARFFPLMLLYTWIELALRRADQQRDQGIQTASQREGNRNFAYIDVLAQHEDRLFARS
jgi:aminoglycoside phosphotransferase (APT) family kinase protein